MCEHTEITQLNSESTVLNFLKAEKIVLAHLNTVPNVCVSLKILVLQAPVDKTWCYNKSQFLVSRKFFNAPTRIEGKICTIKSQLTAEIVKHLRFIISPLDVCHPTINR